jgi:hypothetical protein
MEAAQHFPWQVSASQTFPQDFQPLITANKLKRSSFLEIFYNTSYKYDLNVIKSKQKIP